MYSSQSDGSRYLDWGIALWSVFAGVLFFVPLIGAALGYGMLASSVVELWPIGNYVYMVVLVVSLAALALRVVQKIRGKWDDQHEQT